MQLVVFGEPSYFTSILMIELDRAEAKLLQPIFDCLATTLRSVLWKLYAESMTDEKLHDLPLTVWP